jgi:hypothetical protein
MRRLVLSVAAVVALLWAVVASTAGAGVKAAGSRVAPLALQAPGAPVKLQSSWLKNLAWLVGMHGRRGSALLSAE